MSALCVQRLGPAHAQAYRTLMLQAYAEDPDAFTSTARERADWPLDWWQRRLSDEAGELVWGALVGSLCVGAVGLRMNTALKTRHLATVFGTAVLPGYRRQGLGAQLMQAVLAWADAQAGLKGLQLTVTDGNRAAQALYAGMGFVAWGVQPWAVAAQAGGYVSKCHMALDLRAR